MNQKVCDINDRVIFTLTDVHFHHTAVFLHYHTMHGKWKCYPLIFLYSAIIVSIQICQIRILIKRILFDIQTWRIDMRTQNVHTICNIFLSDMKQRDNLLHSYGIYFITGFQAFSLCDFCFQRFIACCLCFFYDLCDTLTFCFSKIQEISVCFCYRFQFFFFCFCIGKPCVSTFHFFFRLSFFTFLIINHL